MKTPVHLVKSEKSNRPIYKLGKEIHHFTNTCQTCGHVWTSEIESVDCPNTLHRVRVEKKSFTYASTGTKDPPNQTRTYTDVKPAWRPSPDPEEDADPIRNSRDLNEQYRRAIAADYQHTIEEIIKKIYTGSWE